jgi:hypothetical protein
VSETKETKTSRKGIVIVFGIICIILVAGMGGTIAFYTSIINDKNSTISSLNTQISDLKSNVTNLQKQITNLQKLLNFTPVSVGELTANPSPWVNTTVVAEGVLAVAVFLASEGAPWGYELISGNQTIGVSISASINLNASFWNQGFSSSDVRIYGVFEKGEIVWSPGWGPPDVTYYIEAETVESR